MALTAPSSPIRTSSSLPDRSSFGTKATSTPPPSVNVGTNTSKLHPETTSAYRRHRRLPRSPSLRKKTPRFLCRRLRHTYTAHYDHFHLFNIDGVHQLGARTNTPSASTPPIPKSPPLSSALFMAIPPLVNHP
ncbi:hypothetical protein BDZ97DRAFT_1922078 [Flammula alnicola]|nr:hypothetical protein BDZ97DRAFT_1922078 [Flammula alnicola]